MADVNDIFKPSDMASMLSAAILEKMTSDERTATLALAFEYLMTPRPRDAYSTTKPKTPVQEAFERAADNMVSRVAFQIIEDDPDIKARLEKIVRDTIEANLAENSDFQRALAQAVAKVMTSGNGY